MGGISGLSEEGDVNMTDYDKIIDLNNVTIQNCVSLYQLGGLYSVIADGRIVGFEKEDMDGWDSAIRES